MGYGACAKCVTLTLERSSRENDYRVQIGKKSSGVNRRKEGDLKICPPSLRQYFQGQHDCRSLFTLMVKHKLFFVNLLCAISKLKVQMMMEFILANSSIQI